MNDPFFDDLAQAARTLRIKLDTAVDDKERLVYLKEFRDRWKPQFEACLEALKGTIFEGAEGFERLALNITRIDNKIRELEGARESLT
jgi:hypothetical protein